MRNDSKTPQTDIYIRDSETDSLTDDFFFFIHKNVVGFSSNSCVTSHNKQIVTFPDHVGRKVVKFQFIYF